MERKRLGAILLVIGAAVLVLSALADPIGIGGASGMGWKQVVGIVIGAATIVIGVIWMRAGREETDSTAVDV